MHDQVLPAKIRRTPKGRLVLVGGAHSVSDMFGGQSLPDDASVRAFHENINTRAGLCRARGVGYRHYVMPDPLVFASSEMDPADLWTSYFEQHFNIGNEDVFYPFNILEGYPERQLLTDTHYSPLGNLHIAASIAEGMLGIDTKSTLDVISASAVSAPYSGDLAVQCDPVPTEQIMTIKPPEQIRMGHNGLAGGTDGIITLVEAPNATTDRTLLIFGDSFFRGMIMELARYWGRIAFFRTRHWHQRIVEAVQPDDILTGMAERYLGRITPDTEAPDVLAMPLMAGRETSPSKEFGSLFTQMIDACVLNDGAPRQPHPVSARPFRKPGQDEEQFAFVLWLNLEGRASGLAGEELSAAWVQARAAWRSQAKKILAQMQRRGLQIGWVPD